MNRNLFQNPRTFLDFIEPFERSGFCDLTRLGMCQEHWDAGITSISPMSREKLGQGAKGQVEMIAMLCSYCFSRIPNKIEHHFRTSFVEILDRCKGIALWYSPHWSKKTCPSNRFKNIKKRSDVRR